MVDIQNIIGVFFDWFKSLIFTKKLEYLGKNGKKCRFFMYFMWFFNGGRYEIIS